MTHPQTGAEQGAAPIILTVFMLVKTQPEWLALAGDERVRLMREHMAPILREHAGQVRLRYYDAEFYSTRVTDVWMWEVTDREAYERVVEALRDTPIWDRLFDIVEILPAVENEDARRHHQAMLAA
ncbi:darcynin family protein [Paraburkholderia sp.]|jgi:chlorite dismutase|uniref:darcynin family protein n=1 Tax=Paraburkholderia sp. TaxID=1926495 RepID=UPI002F4012EC